MFEMEPIGTVRSPFTDTAQIPKGPGAEHHAEGVLELLPRYEAGLDDIEGFSHLFVLWGLPPRRTAGAARPAAGGQPLVRRLRHALAATAEPDRPDGRQAAAA
jgi:tRNA (adenine37-N6)-methyltransferase